MTDIVYKYDLGYQANGFTFPDPSKFDFTLADLDTEAERDASGTLHRNRVAQKLTLDVSWDVLPWDLCASILQAVDSDSFSFSCPNPKTLTGTYTGTFYVGDRKVSTVWFPEGDRDKAMLSLSMTFIEY